MVALSPNFKENIKKNKTAKFAINQDTVETINRNSELECQISKMKHFAKVINRLQPLTIFTKGLIIFLHV